MQTIANMLMLFPVETRPLSLLHRLKLSLTLARWVRPARHTRPLCPNVSLMSRVCSHKVG
jgi:hypothetical protein